MKNIIATIVVFALLQSLRVHAQLNSPNGILFDHAGHLWVANAGDNNVLELNIYGCIALIERTITDAVSDPTRLALDPSGNLWVSNLNNTLTVYDPFDGRLVETIPNVAFNRPLGVAVDHYGDYYVASNSGNDILAFNTNGRAVETLTKDNSGFAYNAPGAIAIHGENIYIGVGGGPTNAVIAYNLGEFLTGDPQELAVYNDGIDTGPTGVAFDKNGNVYISEYYTPSWVKYSHDGSLLMSVRAGVNGPEGIAVDSSGNVLVANAPGNNITEYSSSGQLLCTIELYY